MAGNSGGTDQKTAAFDWSRFRSTIPSGRASLISGEIESRRRDENSQSASFPPGLKIKVAFPEKGKKDGACGHSRRSNVSRRKRKAKQVPLQWLDNTAWS